MNVNSQFSSEKHSSYQTWGFVCTVFGVILPGILIPIGGISIGIVRGKFSTVYMSTLSDLCNTIARVKSSTYIDHERRKQVVHEILQSQSSLSRLIPQTKSSNQQ